MTAQIEHAETAGGTRTRHPATLTGTRRTYDLRSSTAHSLYELLRGNLQKRERLGGEPTPMPSGRLEPGSLGKKERLGGESTPMPSGRLEPGSLGKKERLGGEPTPRP